MSYSDCLRLFKKNAPDATDDEIEGFIEAHEAHKRYLKSQDASLTDPDAGYKAAKDIAERAEQMAMVEKRNAAINYRVRLELVGHVLNTFGKNPALGLESILVGVQRAKTGARTGAAQIQAALFKRYLGGFSTDLERAAGFGQFASGAMDRDVARALWLLDREGPPVQTADSLWKSLPPQAQEIAAVIRKWQEVSRIEANAAGANIGKRSDYIVRQTHDSERIRRAGFASWAIEARAKFDIQTMLDAHGATDVDKMLVAVYNDLSTGNHLKEASDPTGFKGPGNIAKKLSQSRSILFKDADAWFDYNQQFGTGNLRETVMSGLSGSAQSIGLMKTLGPNPAAMFDAVRDDVILQLKQAGKPSDLEKVGKIDDKRKEYERYMSAVDGTMNRPGSALWARRSANIRAWQSLAKLGGMVLSQLNDIAVYGSGARYQGRGFLSGMHEAVTGLGRDLKPQDRRELLASLGVVLDNMAGELGRAGSFSEAGGMTKQLQTFMKWNLSHWWTSRMKSSAAMGMSHHLALQAGKSFSDLGPDMTRVLDLYGIKEAEWNAIRKSAARQVDGRDYITPDEVMNLSDDDIRAYAGQAISDAALKREREDLAEKLRVYFSDQTETLALEPDAKTRAILLQGTQAGTVNGELMRFLAQFKSFTGAYMQRILGRELFGRGYEGDSLWGALRHGNGEFTGLAQLIVTSTLMGYASMTLKDLAKGRTPRDPTEEGQGVKTLLAAMVQGGGAGIYGDFLFGEASRTGNGFIENLAGPFISTAADAIDIYHRVLAGDDVAAASVNLAINNTPYMNLFYTRLALNYLVLYRMNEGLNPGYLRRTESRMQKENAQTFLVPPSQVVN